MNDLTITAVGNITGDPELRYTPNGAAVVNFQVAHNPREFDRQANEWRDGTPTYFRCQAWKELAENISETLTRGTRVVVTGKLKTRAYETKEGEKRTTQELHVEAIGPELRYATAKIQKTQRQNGQGGNSGRNYDATNGQGGWGAQQADPWAASGQQQTGFSDEAPF